MTHHRIPCAVWIISTIALLLSGCCGIGAFPNAAMIRWKESKEIAVGDDASKARRFLLDNGFDVHDETLYRGDKFLRSLYADRRVGICPLNFTYEYVSVTVVLNDDSKVVSVTVEDTVKPGV